MTVRTMMFDGRDRYRCLMNDQRPVFITMHSTGDMKIFDWERHIEEVQAALTVAVPGNDWGKVHVYGPNTGGFSPPAICIRAELTSTQAAKFLRTLAESAPWLSLPVEVHPATGLVALGGADNDDSPQ